MTSPVAHSLTPSDVIIEESGDDPSEVAPTQGSSQASIPTPQSQVLRRKAKAPAPTAITTPGVHPPKRRNGTSTGARGTPSTAAPTVTRKPARAQKLNEQLVLRIAKLNLRHNTRGQIAKAVGCSVPTVQRYLNHPGFDAATERARAALMAESAESALIGRLDAVDLAAGLVASAKAGAEVDPKLAMEAAKLIMAASAPTPQAVAAKARKDLLASLSPALRKQAMAELAGASDAYLDGLSDAELEALANDA